MSNLTYATTAAARPSALPAPVSPSLLPTGTDSWRDRALVAGTGRRMQGITVFAADHNSIAQPMGAAPATAGRRVLATKPAAPPRGIPR